jgi:hypothetical protein
MLLTDALKKRRFLPTPRALVRACTAEGFAWLKVVDAFPAELLAEDCAVLL